MAVFAGATLYAAESATLNPVKDGFVKQSDNTYYDAYQNMELSSYLNANREIFIDYDLTGVSFAPQHATLKLYVNSVSTATPFILAAYAQTGNVITESLTFTTRPTTGQQKNVDIHAAQDSVGKWLTFDVSDFVKSKDFSTNKLLYFRIVVLYPGTTSTTSPLITIGSNESANKPQLILSDTPVPGIYEVPYASIETLYSSVPYVAAGNPAHAFSGAGLLPEMKHVTAGDNMVWRNSSGTYPIKLMAKFNQPININKLHVWNMNWLFGTGATDYTDRGVKGVTLYVSSSTDDMTAVALTDGRWTKISPDGFQFTRAAGSVSYQGEDVVLTNAENVRWFTFNVLSNFAASNYVGMSEVKFYKEIFPASTPTGLTDIAKPAISISSVDGILSISNISPDSRVDLFNIQGQLICSEVVKGTNLELQIPAGIYVVKANGKAIKALNR